MADVKHKVERAAFGAAIDGILKYVNKDEADREKAFLKLVDLSEKFMGDTFRKESYDAARRMIQDPDSKWMQYVNRILNEVDPHVIKMSALDYGFEAAFCGKKEINEMRVKHQCNIPWLILMDPTSACNLHCTGCWAAEYGNRLNLSFEDMDRIVTQGKELGIYLYFFTGGEPLVRKDDIIRLCEKHDDCGFHAFTNGTLIDEKFCQEMKRVGNFSVAISLEGFDEVNDLRRGKGVFDKVMHAMDLMKQYLKTNRVLLALLAAFVWACYALLSRKISALGHPTVLTTRRTFFYGLAFMLPALMVSGVRLELTRLTAPVNLGNLLFLGLGASALCFVTWNFAVKALGAVKTSVYIYLVPVITVAASVLILREPFTWMTGAGTVLTLIGLLLSEGKLHWKEGTHHETGTGQMRPGD